jgi:ribosomal protein S18
MSPNPPKIDRSKTRKEIAAEYGCNYNTLRRHLESAGIILPKGLVSPKDQRRIYEALGYPDKK